MDRLHFMDFMRAILMMLGVIIHSSQVFNPRDVWLISSVNNTIYSTYIIDFIHAFRMQTFFVVSGYFCLLTLNKYKTKKFLRIRLKRILIPFIMTILTINTLQIILLDYTGWYDFNIKHYITEGIYISHLWFLTNIIIYFLFTAIVYKLFNKYLKKNWHIIEKCLHKLPLFTILFILPIFSIFILSLNKIGFPLYSNLLGAINFFSLMFYAPFFIFGIALATNKVILTAFCNINPWLSTIVIVICTFILNHIVVVDFTFFGKNMDSLMTSYLEGLKTWFAVAICFYMFYNFLNKASEKMKFLSQASYTVYLFHHLLVITFGIIFIKLDVSAAIGIPLLIFLVLLLSLLIHNLIIGKSSLASLLFNGIPCKKRIERKTVNIQT
jgi:glucan biosynthesis protein C